MISTLKQLYKTAIALLEEIELDPLYKIVVMHGQTLVNARYGSLYIARKGVLHREFSTIPEDLQVEIRKSGFTYKAFKSMKVQFIKVARVEAVHREIKDFEVQSVVLIPLCYGEICIGVISLDSYKDSLSEKDRSSLGLFGSMATLAINQAKLYQGMKEAVEQRDMLISLTAHEFRTPLTTINGYAQLLKRKLTKEAPAMLPYVEELHSETNRLINLTNGLLDMSRLKSGRMPFTFENCYLRDIIERAISRFTFAYPDHHTTYHQYNGARTHIIADADKLLQVFSNLLENAGKFTPPGNKIDITVEKTETWWTVKISDSGRGIPSDDLAKIFRGFYKAKNTDESQGMGLGLFITKSIIDAHKGKVTVTSELGIGTTFTIMLPASHDS